MGTVPAADIIKRIAFPAPYTPITFNDEKSELFREGGILGGLNVIPQSSSEIKVYPGSFLTPPRAALGGSGIAVELKSPFTVDIPASLTSPAYLYALTNDEINDEVTIDVSDEGSLPDGFVILAELTTSGRWFRRNPFGIGDLLRQVKGGLLGSLSDDTNPAQNNHTLSVTRFAFETAEPLSVMVFAGAVGGARFKHAYSGSTLPRWEEVGRKDLTISNGDGATPQNWPANSKVEAIASRDIVFQDEQLANGSETTFFFPSGQTIELGSQELLVFVDGILQERSTYTEAAGSVTLDTIYVSGTEIALVVISPVLFRELFTATAGQTDFRLTLNAFRSGARQVLVFVNGRKRIYPDEYTELDGETVQFKTGLTAGDVVEIIGVRSVSAQGIQSITTTSPITGGGEGEEVTIGFNIDAIDAAAAPPIVAAASAIGTDVDRFSREGHTHGEPFPLTSSPSGSGVLPLGDTPGGSVGASGEGADAFHRHPSSGALVASPDRTVEVALYPIARPIAEGASILAGQRITPAGVADVGDHRGVVLMGLGDPAWTATKFRSGWRAPIGMALDYVLGDPAELRFRYGISLDHAVFGGDIKLAIHVTIDGAVVLADDEVLLTPTSISEGVLTITPVSLFLLSSSALTKGGRLRVDLARDKADVVNDTFEGDLILYDMLLQYSG